MKIFKYLIFLLVSLSILIVSCTSNSDSEPVPPGPEPEDTVDLNDNENLFGEWEVGYFTKQVNNAVAARDVAMDGFTITFKKDFTYEEHNTLLELNSSGKFEIKDKNNVKLYFVSKSTGKDTSITLKITVLTDKVLIRKHEYETLQNNKLYNVNDVQYLRNTIKAPNETFEGYGLEAKGVSLTPSYLNGEWKLTDIALRVSDNGIDYWIEEIDNKEKYIGNRFIFDINNDYQGNFTEIVGGGIGNQEKGEVVLIDDVMHSYYYANGESGLIGEMTPMRINILSNTHFEHYSRQLFFTDTNKFQIAVTRAIFMKQP